MINLINSGLTDLKNEIKNMSKNEIMIEKPNETVDIAEKIIEFNREQNQKGHGLKILAPNQMLGRLPT